MARLWPDFRAAFSRPGFVTFKLPESHLMPEDFHPRAVFARSHGFSLGKANAESTDELMEAAKKLVDPLSCDCLHLVAREEALCELLPAALAAWSHAYHLPIKSVTEPAIAAQLCRENAATSNLAIDCILVEPNEWWLGYHRMVDVATAWPGGWYLKALPEHAVSRAYLKMDEALAWSQLPVQAGDEVAEIGCAPGGASQALFERGLTVLGVDPAEVDPTVLANRQFTHIRKRGHEVKRRDFRKTRWLTADMNVAPQYTLDTVEAIVTHSDTNVRGLLLTLKLLEWKLADDLPDWLTRIRSWGFTDVRARQLSHNRREICVAAHYRKTPE